MKTQIACALLVLAALPGCVGDAFQYTPDSGDPAKDASPADALPVGDSAPTADGGADSTPTTDSAVADSSDGSATVDSGSDGSDAADSGPAVCNITNATKCVGDQAQICGSGNTWVNNGSVCTYGCNVNTGLCNCSEAQITVTYPNPNPAGVVVIHDTLSGLDWELYSNGPMRDYVTASASVGTGSCPQWGQFVPTVTQLETLLTQSVLGVGACNPASEAKVAAVLGNKKYWSSTPGSQGTHERVDFTNGSLSTDFDGNATAYVICVNK